MNTKDIWQALSSNDITEPYFDGVFSRDTLKDIKQKPRLIICNTDPSNKPGKHWILFFFHDDDVVDYYDSLGNDLNTYGEEFILFIKRFSTFIVNTKHRTQPMNSDLCGHFCLYYAYFCCKGYKMDYIINKMNSSCIVIKFVKNNFTFPNLKNSRFQCCIKC